ncbi:MAG: DUF4266 domain-containing protein [Bradymonadaceae bacterium]
MTRHVAFLVVIISIWAAGCVTVEPWERGRLAHDCMQVPVDANEAGFISKVEAAREGSSGGLAASGGGCGCN